LLYLAGGDSNPFAVLYLVNIALAGILLQPKWTWALMGLSLLCFGLLFATRSETRSVGSDPLEWQLREMWLAFAIASGLIVYFVQRTVRMLREREGAAETVRRAAEKQEKLASLATLAAGAAHELATPLSTIALVARELERQLQRSDPLPGAIEDVRLIREEVERCRNIMSQMAVDAGESAGEPVERLGIEAIVQRVIFGFQEKKRVRVVLEPAAGSQTLAVPPRAFSQALHAVLKNALQASPEDSEVSLRIHADAASWRIEVTDQGAGMSSEVLARAGEPFFTTKEPGRGMGLGLFLTRSLLEQLGGRLELGQAPGRGTVATLALPRTAEDSGRPRAS
jgi:two-component system sensor histidine kinase RegB